MGLVYKSIELCFFKKSKRRDGTRERVHTNCQRHNTFVNQLACVDTILLLLLVHTIQLQPGPKSVYIEQCTH